MVKRRIAPITPRERLTKKARAAIGLYVSLKAEKTGLRYQGFMVDYVLEAERMKRATLYEILKGYGYKWKAPYWTIKDIDGRSVGGFCPKDRRPRL